MLNIFISHKDFNRNSIIRLSNQDLRDILIDFFSNEFLISLAMNNIELLYKPRPSYLKLFFKNKLLKQVLEKTIFMADKLRNTDEITMLLENINQETHEGIKMLNCMLFLNQVLSGFYPDPSICRVEDDYYLVCSSFSYYLGLPIFHSKDLVNWRRLDMFLTGLLN